MLTCADHVHAEKYYQCQYQNLQPYKSPTDITMSCNYHTLQLVSNITITSSIVVAIHKMTCQYPIINTQSHRFVTEADGVYFSNHSSILQ